MKKLILQSIAIIGLFTTTSLFAAPYYAIIVDAGSTGSRLHLFQYENGDKIPLIKDIFSESTKPGLSSFANHPEDAGISLKKLLDDATQQLQAKDIDPHTVSIRILGTAGMRLLPAHTQASIYNHVTTYIKNNYVLTINEIQTISGKFEALYGWLDVNYLLRSFDSDDDITRGGIDMGGASTQIAFSTHDTSKPEDEISIHINGKTYVVFSKSFTSLGLDQARAAINSNPLVAACYPINYLFNQTDKGNFNFMTCGSLYSELIAQHQVAQQILPLANDEFVAFSGTYYIDNFFGVDQTPDKTIVENHIQRICSKSWEELKSDYPNVPEKYLSVYCANGVYIDNLFYNTYHLQGKQLTVTNQIHQQDIDWTLGALLYTLTQSFL